MTDEKSTSGTLGARLRRWFGRCAKRTPGCVVAAVRCACISCSIVLTSRGMEYDPVIQLDDGQCYGDTVHYRVTGSNPARYYEMISETNFIALLPRSGHFLYRWAQTPGRFLSNFTIDENDAMFTSGAISETTKAIEAAGLSVFSSSIDPSDSRILKLFPDLEVASGYVLGVIDKDCTVAYDMTSRIDGYTLKGAKTSWDGVYYETTSGDVTGESVIRLTNLGAQGFYEDLVAGQKYIDEKKKEERETVKTLPDAMKTNLTETVSFTNIVVTSYYTNKTVIVDPYFKNLNSILKFTYPKYATEGDWIVYSLDRMGVCLDPLTVHLVTNGHWCANVRWEANESGVKKVRVHLPISDEFNDNDPLEVLVKTLNRRVETSL